MIACVVFDFDGVLVESNAVKRQAYFDIFVGLGPEANRTVEAVLLDDLESDRFQLIGEILRHLVSAGVLPDRKTLDDQVVEYAERYNAICEEHAATCPEVPGSSAVIARLVQRYALYVISATPEVPLRRIMDRRGWTPSFRGVLGRPRSKAENLRLVMERERIGGGDIVLVGDGRRDLEAARGAGCGFVGVRNQFNDFDPRGLVMVDDLRGLPDVIASADAPLRVATGS